MDRISNLFGGGKPLIAMAHLLPLPGTPEYDAKGGVAAIVEALRADMDILLAAGFDGILFCNEGDRPYSFRAGYDGVAAMTRVVAELAPKDRPFGVDFLWDSQAALAIAAATGGSFIRGVMTGAYESDMGLWSTDVAALLRERRRLDADRIAMFMNVTPEFATSLGTRSVPEVARSAVHSSLADAILISGPRQGVGAGPPSPGTGEEDACRRRAGGRQHRRQGRQRRRVPRTGRRHHRRLRPQA